MRPTGNCYELTREDLQSVRNCSRCNSKVLEVVDNICTGVGNPWIVLNAVGRCGELSNSEEIHARTHTTLRVLFVHCWEVLDHIE